MHRRLRIACLVSVCALGCSSTVKVERSGGSGGQAGGAVGGGAGATSGGSGGATACTTDADCDDGNRCNGLETCAAGRCVAGTVDSACTGMDAVNCECAVQGAGCAILGRDADHDGYRSTACAADTAATDCNDACAACHPGATEVCDGFDNDCNGSADVFDGLNLYGQPDALLATTTDARAVWWPSQNRYAVIAQDTSSNVRLVLFLIGPDGTILAGPVDVTADTTGFAVGEMYASGDQLGLLLSPGAGGPPMLARYDAQGAFRGSTPIVPANLSSTTTAFFVGTVIAAPNGGWHTVYQRFEPSIQSAYLVRFDQTGAQTGEDFFADGGNVRSAAFGTAVLVSDYDTNSVLATIGSVGAVVDTRTDLGQIHALGSSADRFAVQYGPDSGPAFAELSAGMQTSCGPKTVNANITDTRLASTGALWLGFAAVAGVPNLEIVERGCGATMSLPLATSSIYNGAYGSVAASPKGALLVWRTPSESLAFRAVGPHLCDAPLN